MKTAMKPKGPTGPTKEKAKEILHDGKVRGKPLTKPQRGLMAVIATGKRKY
jgi:hypothetical protein